MPMASTRNAPAWATSFASTKALREAGLERIQAAVPNCFSPTMAP